MPQATFMPRATWAINVHAKGDMSNQHSFKGWHEQSTFMPQATWATNIHSRGDMSNQYSCKGYMSYQHSCHGWHEQSTFLPGWHELSTFNPGAKRATSTSCQWWHEQSVFMSWVTWWINIHDGSKLWAVHDCRRVNVLHAASNDIHHTWNTKV